MPRPGAAALPAVEPPAGGSGSAPLTHALRVQVHGRHLLERDVPGAAIPAPGEAAEHGGGHGRPHPPHRAGATAATAPPRRDMAGGDP